jgi:hypothetical protein
MNNAQYRDGSPWPLKSFIGIALGFLTLTMLFAVCRWKEIPKPISNDKSDSQLMHMKQKDTSHTFTTNRLGLKFKFRPKSGSKEPGDIA